MPLVLFLSPNDFRHGVNEPQIKKGNPYDAALLVLTPPNFK